MLSRFLPSCRGLHHVKSHTQRWRAFCASYATKPQEEMDTKSKGGTASSVVSPLSHPDYFDVSNMTTINELFEARVHLGHKTGCWNPLMKSYLYGSRNGVILFVNERPQFERLTQATARDCHEYFVTQWRSGTLTNSYMLLGTLRLPDLIVFLSVPPSKTAIKEASMCNIPCVGVVDSDCDPNLITYPIPGNDDTPSSLKLYCRLLSEVIKRAKEKRKQDSPTPKTRRPTPLTPDSLSKLPKHT
ncbi:hypothetical protein EMCRGX_G020185 [Ephydatia muelleri]